MENLFNINQAAFILKIHHLTLRRYIKEGKIKAIRVGGTIRIKESDLTTFNKEFVPYQRQNTPVIKTRLPQTKAFTNADPFLRLKGRGASVKLSAQP